MRFQNLRPRVCVAVAIAASTPAAAGAAPAPAGAGPVTAIKAGRLVDVAAGRVRNDHVVLVQDGRVTAVGPAGATLVPPGAKVIDLSGHTVLPGLIDTHTHVTSDPATPPYHHYGISVPRQALIGARFARDTLLSGVTTIRNVGAAGFTDVALRDAINAGDVIGPRILASGPALGITGGHCDSNMLAPEFHEQAEGVADGPVAARTMVRRNVKYGADVIKYCGTGGVFSKGTRVGAQQYTPEEVAAIVDEAHMHGRRVAVHAHGANGIKVAQLQRDNFRKAVQMGIRLTMGTDTGVHPHKDAPKQLATMVEYGMTPMQAIQSATWVGAQALGIDAEVGQIAPGYAADIIAVSGDPLADVRALADVGFVMRGGEVYKE